MITTESSVVFHLLHRINKIYLRAKCFFFNLCSRVVVTGEKNSYSVSQKTNFRRIVLSLLNFYCELVSNMKNVFPWRQKELPVKVVSHSETFCSSGKYFFVTF